MEWQDAINLCCVLSGLTRQKSQKRSEPPNEVVKKKKKLMWHFQLI